MRSWIEPQDIPVPDELHASVGGHPLVAKILAQRGLTTSPAAAGFLDPQQYSPAPASDLPGLSRAVDRLKQAIVRQEAICVWGDFDVDGQTATTLLVSTLRDLGADVTFHIPLREVESHGVNLSVLEQIIERGTELAKPIRLILTCDTGITAYAAVNYANEHNVDFIITDHHELPALLPEAHAIINPKLLPPTHSLATLPGVGVAYKLAEELYHKIDPLAAKANPETYLDLVALGIVADLAIQTGDTRYLLQRGLEVLRNTSRLGLKAMMEAAALNPAWLTEVHIGFMLGPRMNALGRLSDANSAVELLTTRDLSRARVIASQMEGLNTQRQLLTNQVFQAAQAQIEHDPALLADSVLVLSHPSWPGGVIGIVASRLVDQYNRPVVLISAPPGGTGHGSARSIPGVNITDALRTSSDLLTGFGGHAMAAGFSISPDRIPELRRALARTVQDMIGDVITETSELSKPTLHIDGYLPLADLSLELVEDLGRLAPFGPGNPALVLACQGVVIRSYSTIGSQAEHRRVIVEDQQGKTHKVIWWQGAGGELPQGRFDLAYTVRASDYGISKTSSGQRQVEIEWLGVRVMDDSVSAPISQPPTIQVIDYRKRAHPLAYLKQVLSEGEVQVWCEAEACRKISEQDIPGKDRFGLSPCHALVIWTTPPGQSELQAALERTHPAIVYMFGIDPEASSPDAFLKRLAGLVKFTLSRHGDIAAVPQHGHSSISGLAAATAQRLLTVRIGLNWLVARGYIRIADEKEDEITLENGSGLSTADAEQILLQLKALLEETAAYRAFFARAQNLVVAKAKS